MEKDKDILNPIVYKREGKGTWWKMDLRLALSFIITTLQTQVIIQTTQEQYKTIFNLYKDGGLRCIISRIFVNEFYINRLEIGYLIKVAKQVYNNEIVFLCY